MWDKSIRLLTKLFALLIMQDRSCSHLKHSLSIVGAFFGMTGMSPVCDESPEEDVAAGESHSDFQSLHR